MTDTNTPANKLDRLISYLESDPDNTKLRKDIADTALTEHRADIALDTLMPLVKGTSVSEDILSLVGLAHMQLKQFDAAAAYLAEALKAASSEPGIRFNLAWSRAMLGEKSAAIDLLDASTVDAIAPAAMLHVQLIHEMGDLERAAALAEQYVERHPGDEGLHAAVSVLALDLDNAPLARHCAERSGPHPEALATLGTLALNDDDPETAAQYFASALDINKSRPRAWIGLGLTDIAAGNHTSAAARLDKGAELFEGHIGSWIGAGWAYLLAGELDTARQRFETAMSLDHNFAESHGSIAVLDAMEGLTARAKSGAERALRLDRQCFSAALATTLLLSAQGADDTAKRMFDIAINTPFGADGRTIAQSLNRLGLT